MKNSWTKTMLINKTILMIIKNKIKKIKKQVYILRYLILKNKIFTPLCLLNLFINIFIQLNDIKNRYILNWLNKINKNNMIDCTYQKIIKNILL